MSTPEQAAETVPPDGIPPMTLSHEERQTIALESIAGGLRRIATALEEDKSVFARLFGKRL